MRSHSTKIAVLFSLSLAIIVTACKKDDEPFIKPKLSMTKATVDANEDDGTIDIGLTLDRAYSEDVIVEYTLKGTAVDKISAGADKPYDYEVVGTYLEAKILKGETTGKIQLKLLSDLAFENPETILIAITKTNTENIEITRDDETEVTVGQEDGMAILLEWPAPSASGQADMDLVLWAGASVGTWDGILGVSYEVGFTGPELIFLPKVANFPAYGVGCVYYDGTLEPLNFKVTYIDFVNAQLEPVSTRLVYEKSYTKSNLNKYTNLTTTKVVQTFLKTGGAFTIPSEITVPSSGSRERTNKILNDLISIQRGTQHQELPRLLRELN